MQKHFIADQVYGLWQDNKFPTYNHFQQWLNEQGLEIGFGHIDDTGIKRAYVTAKDEEKLTAFILKYL